MNNTERDINVLTKLLDSELFLGKYPFIVRVWVSKFANNTIDIVLGPSDTGEFWPVREEIYSYIHNLAKMAGVTTRFNIYP